jgi:hypothetical protein
MATRLQITCIKKMSHFDPYQRITEIGGVFNGRPWKYSQVAAIRLIESRECEFYVVRGGVEVKVVVAMSPYNNKCIKTEADNTQNNNLLSLPDCA